MSAKIVRNLAMSLILAFVAIQAFSQIPQGFSYQAVIRNATGQPLVSQSVKIQITLTDEAGSITHYQETHTITTSPLGLVNLTVGGGTFVAGTFSAIPWQSGAVYIKVEVDPTGGTSYTNLGATKLSSVPYALFAASGTPGPQGPIGPVGPNGTNGANGSSIQWLGELAAAPSSPLLNQSYYNTNNKKSYVYDGDSWEIITQDGATGPAGPLVAGTEGQTLAHDGTTWTATNAITVNGQNVGIGNLNPQTKLVVQSESTAQVDDPIFEVRNKDNKVVLGVYNEGVRIYVEDATTKGARGGFAVGGLTNQSKGTEREYFRITPDSARIYVKDTLTTKGARGGFAVGGLTSQNKGVTNNYLYIHRDSARIYIDDATTPKGARGGFAVGGLTNQSKGTANEFLRISRDSARIHVNTDQKTKSGSKGGFAVGGLSPGKEGSTSFMFLTPENYFIGQESGQKVSETGLYNSTLGYRTGVELVDGTSNIFIGYESGNKDTTGSYNTFLGFKSGYNNNANFNTFFGYEAGLSNTKGRNGVFLGYKSGSKNTLGDFNTFIGNYTGYNNTVGFKNIFIGDSAGSSNVNGNRNIFLGPSAGISTIGGEDNVFIGTEAGVSNTTSMRNIFIGSQAGFSNTTGRLNIFIGAVAGVRNTIGERNIYIGQGSGYNSDSANYNVFIGDRSGSSNKKGGSNVLIGWSAGINNTNGNSNVYLGDKVGYTANGSNNVFIGSNAGYFNKGSNNILIGLKAGYNELNSNRLYIENSESNTPLIFGDFTDGSEILGFNASVGIGNQTPSYKLDVNGNARTTTDTYLATTSGNVGVGTTTADKKLHVAGDIRVEGDIFYGPSPDVTIFTKPDFVFTAEYNNYLEPFKVAEFIKTNGHLPWMTSAREETDGINLTRMQFETLETVENLQLQIIELKKDYQSQIILATQENNQLKTEMQSIKAELEAIKALLKK
ncbi:MAG: hypothetical protein AB9846_07075 [Tenuifilaceae bacterium]